MIQDATKCFHAFMIPYGILLPSAPNPYPRTLLMHNSLKQNSTKLQQQKHSTNTQLTNPSAHPKRSQSPSANTSHTQFLKTNCNKQYNQKVFNKHITHQYERSQSPSVNASRAKFIKTKPPRNYNKSIQQHTTHRHECPSQALPTSITKAITKTFNNTQLTNMSAAEAVGFRLIID